ncbi:M23 family metallopeptidase [Dialister invisus]|mgnify:FL=1|jgi:murein DD-endopeptidase MepM/ murein hydrolase activator NlpD|uniref:M23 family metallopeptidase n=1 Tax=Dialister invisus TaxID=218538 RepID=UPI00033C70DA|nr:M23 family metallopeptidase [Dialister invisus]MUU09860.1 M23 family metallopeptidase [Dialister invisus]CCZ53836.1 peptidase M23/M37 family [Dialister invisus CAG:218]
MIKEKNEETGEVKVIFSSEEFKKLKIFGGAAAVLLILSISLAGWAGYNTNALHAENELYRSQLKMADEKMQALENKAKTVEKISGQLQELVRTNGGTVPENTGMGTGGIGGASTVPDIAKTAGDKKEDDEKIAVSETPGELLKEMRRLDERLDKQIRLVVALRSEFMNQAYGAVSSVVNPTAETPNIWPVAGPISSYYGYRTSPGGIGSTFHEGVDIAGDYGTPISATAAGTVTQAGWVGGYGYLVEVKHADGIVTRYGHNSAVLVYEGQHVDQGSMIALMGSTGNSTGPHCHYEVRIHGEAVDPMYFLPQNY